MQRLRNSKLAGWLILILHSAAHHDVADVDAQIADEPSYDGQRKVQVVQVLAHDLSLATGIQAPGPTLRARSALRARKGLSGPKGQVQA